MSGNGCMDTDHRTAIIEYWMEKARESMESAQSEFEARRNSTAVRNLYYACFYALTAVLLKNGHSFRKHTAVKAALHKEIIRRGIIDPAWGKFYNGSSTVVMKGITSRSVLSMPRR